MKYNTLKPSGFLVVSAGVVLVKFFELFCFSEGLGRNDKNRKKTIIKKTTIPIVKILSLLVNSIVIYKNSLVRLPTRFQKK